MPAETIHGRTNGSIRIPGPIILVRANGAETRIDKESIGFCRCGASKDKPLCDGSHREIGFEAEEFVIRPG
jgi:CDGSH-type Zn-finger protein